MGSGSLLEWFAREHPAFVHVPLGLVATLPLAMVGSFLSPQGHRWTRTAFFMAAVAWFSSAVALGSGLLWGRQIGLILPGAFLPPEANATQVIQRMLRLHIYAALVGVLVGALCLALIWRAWGPGNPITGDHDLQHGRHLGRRFWERGVGLPALFAGLLWLGAWGFCGKLGGVMVFGNEETNRASAEAEAKRKNDVEADLPIRALDYGSLEPLTPEPQMSQAHGGFWVRTWVPASGIDAYRAGKPLAPGAYTVLSTFLDQKGKPSHELGPLYFKEVLADGNVAFAYYWAKVPEGKRAALGGEDAVYWRSPHPNLAVCATCHVDAGPARPAPSLR